MFQNIQSLNWFGQRVLFGVGFAGLCLAFIGLLSAYQFAMNMLHTVFPEHLVRMYRGLKCESSVITYHRGLYGLETKKGVEK